MLGKKIWALGDGFMNDARDERFESHEALCVLNVSGNKAKIEISVFFEDKEPLTGFFAECENNRTNHIRLDKIVNKNGEQVPYNTPYALILQSDEPIIVQHSRMDVSQANMTLMTTIAYS